MICKIAEFTQDYVRFADRNGFVSVEHIDGEIVIDSLNAPDMEMSPAKARNIADWLYKLADRAEAFVPLEKVMPPDILKGESFVAVSRRTRVKALNGGVCVCKGIKQATRKYFTVIGEDADGEPRFFTTKTWKIIRR